MAGDSAIAEVGQTLVGILGSEMTLLDTDEISLASPASVGDGNDARLTLYLYRVTENGDLKNVRRAGDSDLRYGSPLVVDLHYLLTAHPSTGGNDETGRTSEQHSLLGQAMRVLHDNAILRGSDLVGSLAAAPEEEVRIGVTPTEQPSFDALVSLWGTFPEQAYQPSLSYLVSPVQIESTAEVPIGRVTEKEEQYFGGSAQGREKS